MFIKLIRLGKDAELKSTSGGQLLSINAAYDVGYGDKKKTQWIGLTLFGERAEKVAHLMTKGQQIVACMDDVQAEEYNGKAYLKAKLVSFELCGGKPQASANQQNAEYRGQQSPPAAKKQSSPDIDDDLPF